MCIFKRSAIVFMIISISIIPISGCCFNKSTNNENDSINSIGNYSNNIIDHGLVGKQGDWIYYYSIGGFFNIGQGLYKSKIDGSKMGKIESGKISNINILGDWIYYVTEEEYKKGTNTFYNYNLYKSRTDGSQKCIVLNNCNNVNIINNNIYYKIYTDEMSYQLAGVSDYPLKNEFGRVYCMKLDGSQKTKLIDKSIGSFLIDGNYIYYNDNSGIYKSNIDGSNTSILVSRKVDSFRIYNNKLYYYETYNFENNETTINILDLSTGKTEINSIPNKQIVNIMPYQNKLFYIVSNSCTYMIKESGESEQEIAKGIYHLYIFDNDIYGWNLKGIKKMISD